MPRARKTQTGAPAMGIQQIPGQQYGKGPEQVALQKAMPAPQAPTLASPLPQGGPASGTPAPPPGAAPATAPASAPADPFGALRDRVGLLGQPTNRPDEPITAGLTGGPGPGPEVLGVRQGSPLGNTLRNLSNQLGDPYFARLADRARL